MTVDELDPLIHTPARLRIVATLAALPEGDTLSFTRLQTMIGLTPGNLITHLRKLEDAGYVDTLKTGNGQASRTDVVLTQDGRAAFTGYSAALRELLGRRVVKPSSRLAIASAALVVALGLLATSAGAGSVGTPPPEWAANADGWPAHDLDLSNTRADFHTRIDAQDVAKLKERWTFRLPYAGNYGSFTSNPIVLHGVVYLEDPDSDVYALDQATGKLVWQHDYHSVTPSGGPNGVAYGYGLLFGATESSVFALDPHSGKQVWIRKLTVNANEGIDMAPQLYDGKLLISTIPGNSSSFYTGGAWGVVYALDARTGKEMWSFSTVKGGAELWGDPKVNGGGGLWYPPAVDAHGRVFLGTANPGPYPLSKSDPNARSRPGPNLYTDSLVALDGATGKLLWYRQVTPHDLRDYDFQDPPVVVTVKVDGVATEAVIGAGKSGQVVAFRASDGKRLWTLAIGAHNRYQYGPLPAKPVLYCPGSLGGVLTPMAEARGVLYVPWLDACFKGSATGLAGGGGKATGDLAAVDAATGAIRWKRTFPTIDSGAATVANDVVFTSTFDGTIYALSTKTGATLWKTKAPVGINSFPALTRTMLIVGAGARTSVTKAPKGELVAYALPGT